MEEKMVDLTQLKKNRAFIIYGPKSIFKEILNF